MHLSIFAHGDKLMAVPTEAEKSSWGLVYDDSVVNVVTASVAVAIFGDATSSLKFASYTEREDGRYIDERGFELVKYPYGKTIDNRSSRTPLESFFDGIMRS